MIFGRVAFRNVGIFSSPSLKKVKGVIRSTGINVDLVI